MEALESISFKPHTIKPLYDVFKNGFINTITQTYWLANGVNQALQVMLGDKYTPPRFSITTHFGVVPTIDEYNAVTTRDIYAYLPSSELLLNSWLDIQHIEISLTFTLSNLRSINASISKDIHGKQLIVIHCNKYPDYRIVKNPSVDLGNIEYPIIVLDSVHELAKSQVLLSFIEDSLVTKYDNVCTSINCPSYDTDIGCVAYNIVNGDKCHLMVYAENKNVKTHVNDGANSFYIDKDSGDVLKELTEINKIASKWNLLEVLDKK